MELFTFYLKIQLNFRGKKANIFENGIHITETIVIEQVLVYILSFTDIISKVVEQKCDFGKWTRSLIWRVVCSLTNSMPPKRPTKGFSINVIANPGARHNEENVHHFPVPSTNGTFPQSLPKIALFSGETLC